MRLRLPRRRRRSLKACGSWCRAKLDEEGKLFGSVGAIDVAAAINSAGVEVDRSQVRMHGDSIRQLGDYEVEVQFHADVAATITVAVEAEA